MKNGAGLAPFFWLMAEFDPLLPVEVLWAYDSYAAIPVSRIA